MELVTFSLKSIKLPKLTFKKVFSYTISIIGKYLSASLDRPKKHMTYYLKSGCYFVFLIVYNYLLYLKDNNNNIRSSQSI